MNPVTSIQESEVLFIIFLYTHDRSVLVLNVCAHLCQLSLYMHVFMFVFLRVCVCESWALYSSTVITIEQVYSLYLCTTEQPLERVHNSAELFSH